jgi:glutamyl-tRNA synthetase
MTQKIRTRIAPSPTGFLHLGTARTALYSWAFARHFGGEFVLRIEDTDVARSTQDSVDQILASMKWLGLDYDEGPIYQMQRLDRYRAVVDQLIAEGKAYRCYATPEELDVMREAQKARGEKTHYDGRWRPEPGKRLPEPPAGVQAVIRFANPKDGVVTWGEIDDLIIMRADGVPTSTSPWWWTTGTCRSATSSAATSTSTTHRGRSTSSTHSVRRCPCSAMCR